MKKIYASKYNYVEKLENEMLIYNSLTGVNSLIKINNLKNKSFCDLLLKKIEFLDIEEIKKDELFYELLSKQIICFSKEKQIELRNKKYHDYLNENNLNIIIMATEKCNLRCSYCYEEHRDRNLNINTQSKIIEFVEKNIVNYKALVVNWFGGEPLCNMEVIEKLSVELMKICRKNKKPYISTMTTNGCFLTLETCKKLMKFNVLGYQVTLDGFKQSHDKNRHYSNGMGSYDQILINLISISKHIKSNLIRIAIRSNFNNESYKDIESFFEDLKRYFENDPRFSIDFNLVTDLGNISKKEKQKILSKKEITHFYEKASYYIPKMLERHFVDLLDKVAKCYASQRNSYVFGVDGKVYKCTVHFEDEINNVGNLFNFEHEIIDNNKNNIWIKSGTEIKHPCDNCFLQGICMNSSCPYHVINNNTVGCLLFKNSMSFIINFLNNVGYIQYKGENHELRGQYKK